MDFLGAGSTLVGAVLGVVATLAAQYFEAGRTEKRERFAARQEIYADYLASVARAFESLRWAASRFGPPATDPTRSEGLQRVFQESGSYEWRYRMSIRASDPVQPLAEECFLALRGLRDGLMDRDWSAPEVALLRDAVGAAADRLQAAMRSEGK